MIIKNKYLNLIEHDSIIHEYVYNRSIADIFAKKKKNQYVIQVSLLNNDEHFKKLKFNNLPYSYF